MLVERLMRWQRYISQQCRFHQNIQCWIGLINGWTMGCLIVSFCRGNRWRLAFCFYESWAVAVTEQIYQGGQCFFLGEQNKKRYSVNLFGAQTKWKTSHTVHLQNKPLNSSLAGSCVSCPPLMWSEMSSNWAALVDHPCTCWYLKRV